MRLARVNRPLEGNSLLVREVPPPHGNQVIRLDRERVFAETYQRLHGSLLDFAERMVGKENARDVVGDAVLALWINLHSLTPGTLTDNYFFAAVRNRAYKVLDENMEIVSLEDAEIELERMAVREAGSSYGTRGDLRADVLDAALAAMPPRRRAVLLLVKEQGFGYEEAAEILGLSIGTINTHIRLANQHLRAAFERAGFRIINPQPRRLLSNRSPKGDATND